MASTGDQIVDNGILGNTSDMPNVNGCDKIQFAHSNEASYCHDAVNLTTNGNEHGFSNGPRDYISNVFSAHSNFEIQSVDQPAKRSMLSAPELISPEGPSLEPIAIAVCGVALRLPGGIRDPKTFWDALLSGKDMRSTIPSSRYNSAGFLTPATSPYGYFLDEDLTALDTSFFNMRKSELEVADPQQRQLLEVTRECLENAGEVEYRGKAIGCYVGTFGDDWLQMMCKDSQSFGASAIGGYTDMMLANRVSYEYDFHGPSIVFKTGCSSSLVGLHEACRALQYGDCEAAIVAGTSLIMTPLSTGALSQEGVISPEGSSKTFDSSADGYARGEAINAVFIKRLDDAVRDKNPIRAVIRGTGTNSDGRGQGLMAPNGKAQEDLMRKLYFDCGLDPGDTAYVECHGTGTPTGDPIEASAIGNVFGERGVLIGAVKPNVGHSEGASGITSLIKAVLTLENKIIPPNIKFHTPNPRIPFKEKGLVVPVIPTSFPTNKSERISVSSYGIGGSNAHVIIDSLEQFRPDLSVGCSPRQTQSSKLLIFSANTPNSLRQLVLNYEAYLEIHPDTLEDLSYTLAMRREKLSFRSFSVVQPNSKITMSPILKGLKRPSVAMVFSGQGAQWAQMGNELLTTDYRFRRDIRLMDDVLHSLKHAPEWTMEEELQRPAEKSRIHCSELSQPLCTAIQIALVNAYARYGIFPTTVIGHSSGEIAAVYAAGGLSLREAVIISYYRGMITKKQTLKGGMAAVGLSVPEISESLLEGVEIACENSPTSITISGDATKVGDVMAAIKSKRPDVLVRALKVDMAYHSNHMKPLALEYLELLRSELGTKFESKGLHVPMFSTVSGDCVKVSSSLSVDYWSSNLLSPVLFDSAARKLMSQFSDTILLELGPHSTLAGPLREIGFESKISYNYVSTLLRFSSSHDNFLSALGQLYQLGVHVDFTSLVPSQKNLHNLPTYPWDRTSYWSESRVSKDWRSRRHPHHPLLGQEIAESSTLEPSWRVLLSLENEPWLRDHKVLDDVVFPLAGYIAMAGEAIRQLSGIEDGYEFRHIVAHTALVLMDSQPIELITNLRSYRLTDVSKSSWYEFSISSCAGSSWIEHCHGQVRAATGPGTSTDARSISTHEVSPSKWYNRAKHVGLDYGPEFRNLANIRSSAEELYALGRITISESQLNTPFLAHPCTLDSSFQLMLVPLIKERHKSAELFVPTMIEELYISSIMKNMEAKAWISNSRNQNGIDGAVDGKVVIRLRNMRLSHLLKDNPESGLDRHAAAFLHWSPDFDFLDFRSFFRTSKANEYSLVEELGLLIILDTAEQVQGITPHAPHLDKFGSWLRSQARSAHMGAYPIVPGCHSFAKLTKSERLEAIESRYHILKQLPGEVVPVDGFLRLWKNMPDIFKGDVNPLDLLLQDNVLAKFYDSLTNNFGSFLKALSNKRPTLRILEVGAGTGGATAKIFKELLSIDSIQNPPYAVYTFTDISAGFFEQAKDRFSAVPKIEYQIFDISKDPLDQGFTSHSYDLIIAANCVHATPKLQDTLRNLESLLRLDGYLLLSELCSDSAFPRYIFGVFSGWWIGEVDDRKDSPIISLERWDKELKSAGFSGAASFAFEREEPYNYCAAIIAQPSNTGGDFSKSVAVLCDKPSKGISHNLIKHLRSGNFEVSIAVLGQDISQKQSVISTLDLEAAFFDTTEERFEALKNLMRHSKPEKFLWLLPPSQVRCRDPSAAKSLGMLRIVRAELAIPVTTLEICNNETDLSTIVTTVFEKIQPYTYADNLLPDMEFVFDHGVIKSSRFYPFSLETALKKKRKQNSNSNDFELRIEQLGLLDSLGWIEKSKRDLRFEENEVNVDVRAVGINFRDLAVALGLIPFSSEKIPLGLEFAGVIRQIGSQVKDVSVGDRVFGFAAGGLFSSNAVLPSFGVVKIPDQLSFEDAATMPVCFVTVMIALFEVGKLKRDQSILIHSACGGVGHAAIQISRVIGAQVFATVSSEAKIKYLVENFSIPRDHIFHSRDDSFLPKLLQATNGRGADLVLNSLSGELLHASWKCVAEFGKLIELGKRDLVEFGKLNMEPFLANRSYCCIDLAHMVTKKPEKCNQLLKRCLELYERGKISPIHPITTFEAKDIENAFRYLERGNHIGKAILRIPCDVSTMSIAPNLASLQFDRESSYLITGGLGGLGKGLVTWMAERGAQHFILLSRTAGLKREDLQFIEDMEATGCSVLAIAGQAQNEEDVVAAVRAAQKPIRGVFHLAMVLRDAQILDMKYSDWTSVIATKCTGAWNLHNILLSHSLDFFVLASSIAAQFPNVGQSNYAAANTFLEAFCQYRHSLSLPASVISICPIDDIGFVAENPDARKTLNAQGLSFLSQKEFLEYAELAVLNSHPEDCQVVDQDPNAIELAHWNPLPVWHNSSHLIMGLRSTEPLSDNNTQTSWRHDRRMGFYHNGAAEAGSQRTNTNQLSRFLSAARSDPAILKTKQAIEFLSMEIGIKIFTLMLRKEEEVELNMKIRDIGLDSLMAIELRRWWRQTFRVEISMLEIMGKENLVELGELAANRM